jgi:hypothetical protein
LREVASTSAPAGAGMIIPATPPTVITHSDALVLLFEPTP